MTRYLFIALLLFGGCKKPGETVRTSVTTYDVALNITNPGYPALHYRIYTSHADFMENKNPFISADGDTRIFLEDQQKIDSLYYDVYSDDYKYSNWGTPNNFAVHTQTFSFEDFISNIDLHRYVSYVSDLRRIFLDGNKASTTWRAIDVITASNVSVWNTFEPYRQYHRLELYKDKTFRHVTHESNGKEKATVGIFTPGGTGAVCTLTMMADNYSAQIGNVATWANPVPTTDTALFSFDSDYFWVMVRE